MQKFRLEKFLNQTQGHNFGKGTFLATIQIKNVFGKFNSLKICFA